MNLMSVRSNNLCSALRRSADERYMREKKRERHSQFQREYCRKRYHLGDLGIDGRLCLCLYDDGVDLTVSGECLV